MKTVHLFDQHHEGKNTSHYLMMADGEIPRIVHRSEETGEWVDGYRHPPGETQARFVRKKLLGMKTEVYTMGVKRCPHCHKKAKHAECRRCLRDMCEDCISHQPTVGQVCGLCSDEIEREINKEEKRKAWEAI